jgi:hypothetical protein
LNLYFYTQSPDQKRSHKVKFNLPLEKKIFVYGGNLGKLQASILLIPLQQLPMNLFFLIVGTGTEYQRVENEAFKIINQKNADVAISITKARL